jgi:hypothetical protein
VASRSSGSGCPRCSVPGRSLFEEEVAELLRAATQVLVLTDVSVRGDRRRWRIDLKVVTPTPLLIDLDPAPWHAREGSAERDQRKLEAVASPDYIRVRQGGLPPLVGRARVVSDHKKPDPWEWAEAVRDDVVSAGGAWTTVSEQERANARGRAFDHWQHLIARGPDPAAIDVAPALAPEFLANLTRTGIALDRLPPSAEDRCRWRCSFCSNIWEANLANRVRGAGCPRCAAAAISLARRSPAPGESLLDANPELAAQFLENITRPETGPGRLKAMSNQRCRWRCPAGHEWIAPVAARTRGYGCPECGAAKVAAQWVLPRPGRSFAELNPEESRQFVRNLTRPGIDPTKLRPRSIDRCIWRCERCDSDWEATPDKRGASGRGCPICAETSRATARATAPAQKSLAVMYPDLAREFVDNITRPGHGADVLRPGSNMRCYWHCPQCRNTYLATVNQGQRARLPRLRSFASGISSSDRRSFSIPTGAATRHRRSVRREHRPTRSDPGRAQPRQPRSLSMAVSRLRRVLDRCRGLTYCWARVSTVWPGPFPGCVASPTSRRFARRLEPRASISVRGEPEPPRHWAGRHAATVQGSVPVAMPRWARMADDGGGPRTNNGRWMPAVLGTASWQVAGSSVARPVLQRPPPDRGRAVRREPVASGRRTERPEARIGQSSGLAMPHKPSPHLDRTCPQTIQRQWLRSLLGRTRARRTTRAPAERCQVVAN